LRKLILAFLAGAAAAPLAAQTATLVKDINTRSDTAGSLFEHLTAVGGNLFFTTSGQVTGEDLWVSDGTAAGTRDLLHPCPGSCGSGVTFLGSLRKVLLFSEDGAFFGGYQLWRSDGSAPGTFRLAPGVAASGGLAALNALDAAFAFVGCTVTTPPSCGLWRTDGRAEGTVRLKDLGNVQIGEMAVAGRRLFFPVTDHGALSLWSSDGTAAGTSRIKTLSPGLPGNLAAAGPRLLFFVTGSDQKPELWTSDGTSGGTFALQSFSSADLFAPLVTAGGRAYFVADDGVLGQEVWTSDGTPAGTRRVTGFSLDNTFISALQAFGNRVFFIASDGVHGYQIWSTAGTLDSTTAVTTPCTGCNFVNTATELTAAANGLVFPADDGVHGSEPWITDGTAQGTHLIADLCPGDCESIGPDNREMTPTPQGVLFSALDPSGSEDLWRTDGTAAGTVRLSALGAGGRILPDSDRPPIHLEAASLGATLFFGASNAAGHALWATTEHAAARRVAVVGPQGSSSSPYFLTPYGDRLLFFTPPDNSAGGAASAMWITQGTEEGMEPFGVGLGYISAAESVQSAGLAFFRLSTTDAGHVLVRSDGTDAGSEILAYPAEPGITVFNGRVFFALPGSTAPEIWSTDGTSAGTRKEFALPDGTPEAGYVSAPGTGLYFITGDVNGSKVWRSDGTLAGTQPLADLPPTFFTLTDYSPAFTRLGSRVLFVAPGNSVRSTDGTPAGTVALTNGGVPLGQTYRLVPFNGAVYFFGATAGARGIFRTDGTSAGTVFIQEVPGLTDGTLADAQLVAGGGRLWFTNDDSDHSTELCGDGEGHRPRPRRLLSRLAHLRRRPALLLRRRRCARRRALAERRHRSRDAPGAGHRPPRELVGPRPPDRRRRPPLLHRRRRPHRPRAVVPAALRRRRLPAFPTLRHRSLSRRPVPGGGALARFRGQRRRRPRRPAHRRHRDILVLRSHERGNHRQGPRRPRGQRPRVGVLRRAVERRIHAHRHRHPDRPHPAVLQPAGTARQHW